jgi:hypothetical protein
VAFTRQKEGDASHHPRATVQLNSRIKVKCMKEMFKSKWFPFNILYHNLVIVWTSILLVAFAISYYNGFPTKGAVYFILLFGPLIYIPRIQNIITNNNIIFMAIITFLWFPLCLSFWLSYFIFKGTGYEFLAILLGVTLISVIIFFLKFITNKTNMFLDNVKISLEIIRLIFVVILSLTAIFLNFMNEFPIFNDFITIKTNNVEETRKYYVIFLQAASFPFIFSTTALKIAADYLLLRQKREKT